MREQNQICLDSALAYSHNNPFLKRPSILLPRADVDVIERHGAESADEGRGQTTVGDKGHVQVDGGTANLVTVGELVGGEVLGDVDHHVDLVAVEHVEGGGQCLPYSLLGFARPEDAGVLDAVLGEVSGGSSGGEELVAMGSKHAGGIKHLGLLLG